MPKTKPFAELKAEVMADPARRERVATIKQAMVDALALAELRDQPEVTEKERLSQATILRIEHEEDLYLSTLRDYVAALGGELEVIAVFPDGEVILVPAER